jgi:hypothetical protein
VAEVNELLREHVLRTRFELTLTKTQIRALVELHAWDGDDAPHPTWIYYSSQAGMLGLVRRGLVREVYWPLESNTYQITRAGALVVELLKESGIYQHYMTAAPAEAVR